MKKIIKTFFLLNIFFFSSIIVYAEEISINNSSELKDCVQASNKCILNDDIVVDDGSITINNDVTIQLNGHTMSYKYKNANNYFFIVKGKLSIDNKIDNGSIDSDAYVFSVLDGELELSNLKLTNNRNFTYSSTTGNFIDGTGKVIINNCTMDSSAINNNSMMTDITVNSGEMIINGLKVLSHSYVIYSHNHSDTSSLSITINSADITSSSTPIDVSGNAKIIINDVNLITSWLVSMNIDGSSNAEINGGNFGRIDIGYFSESDSKNSTIINGGMFTTILLNANNYDEHMEYNVIINGGTITNGLAGHNGNFIINGGTIERVVLVGPNYSDVHGGTINKGFKIDNIKARVRIDGGVFYNDESCALYVLNKENINSLSGGTFKQLSETNSLGAICLESNPNHDNQVDSLLSNSYSFSPSDIVLKKVNDSFLSMTSKNITIIKSPEKNDDKVQRDIQEKENPKTGNNTFTLVYINIFLTFVILIFIRICNKKSKFKKN